MARSGARRSALGRGRFRRRPARRAAGYQRSPRRAARHGRWSPSGSPRPRPWCGPAARWADFGERTGWHRVGDADGDGAEDVGRPIAEATSICGRDLPLLHRRAYDWSSGALRTVSAPRAGLDSEGATALSPVDGPAGACFGPAGEESAEAEAPACPILLPALAFRSASSSYGDGGEPLQGAPPTGLEDMNGRTGWAEGVGGAGRLEFATARIGGGALPARLLAVRATDDADPTAPKTRARSRSLLLVDGDGRRWTLALPDDAVDELEDKLSLELLMSETLDAMSVTV